MTKSELICFGLLILFGCSTINNDGKIEGHWHCIDSGQCEFETIDIKDTTIVSDKYIIGSFSHFLYIGQDVKVQMNGDKLSLNYVDTSYYFYRSDLKVCLLPDRYKNCMIDLSLPEVASAFPFDSSNYDYTTGDLLIGKLRLGLDDKNDRLAKQYPDSIFIQVNDVLIKYKDIPDYLRELKSCLDCPKESINLHVDKDVPEEIVDTVVLLINPGVNRSTIIYNVVKIKNGDVGLQRR
jgi:hypothetical protein